MGDAGTLARSASVRSWGEDTEVDKLRVGRGFLISSGLTDSRLALRMAWTRTVLSGLARPSSSGSTRTPLRFAFSDSRSSSRDKVEEMEGKAACVCIDRGVPKFVDGGLERGKGCEYEGEIDARGDEEGVDAGVRRGVEGGEGLLLSDAGGGGGSGCDEQALLARPSRTHVCENDSGE